MIPPHYTSPPAFILVDPDTGMLLAEVSHGIKAGMTPRERAERMKRDIYPNAIIREVPND